MSLPSLSLALSPATASRDPADSARTPCSVDPTRDLSARQQGALEELRLFRQTLDSLKARLPALEYYVAHSSAAARDEDAAELDAIVQSFGDPVTEISSTRDDASGSTLFPTASTSTSSSTSAPTSEPPKKRQRVSAVKQDPDESEAAVQAAIDLEFHSLGRPRVWHESNARPPDGAGDDADDDGLASPSIRRAVLPPEPHPESPVALYPDARALFDAAPTPDQEDVIFSQGLDIFGFHVRPCLSF